MRREDRLLTSFDYETAALLTEFGKFIAELEADYLVFMARKALRLYDFLLLAGAPIAQKPAVSDHVLDQDLRIFQGKRIALIDDTLILGTTLGEAIRKLRSSGASEVTTHVFCVDEDNYARSLVAPDTVFRRFNGPEMLTFCISEVSAFSCSAIPYLSDFPFSEQVRFSRSKYPLLHTMPSWEAYSLTTPEQESAGISTHTFLPRAESQEKIRELLGGPLFNLLEIVKIRSFCTKKSEAQWIRFVSVVTLKAVPEPTVLSIFDAVLFRLEGSEQDRFGILRKQLSSSISRIRFVQYVLSMAVGHLFLSEALSVSEIRSQIRFDMNEAVRLFGPWLRSNMQAIHTATPLAFRPETRASELHSLKASAVELPAEVAETSKSDFLEFVQENSGGTRQKRSGSNLLTDLVRAFLELHKKYELPAREEAHRLGPRIYEAAPIEAPHRDRLKFGFAWAAIAEHILGQHGIRLTLRRSNLLTLVLDQLIDLGIAVPVLCERDGVLFRAYRHGEGVEFGDQEIALAYEAVKAYLENSGRPNIAQIPLEKLLVSLLRIGAGKRFLKVMNGLTGTEGLARIAFHLHGAIVTTTRQDTIYGDDRDSWLSRHLVERGVIRQDDNRLYVLGDKPTGGFIDNRALSEAGHIGGLLGLVTSASSSNGGRLLNEQQFIVLTSCSMPRDAVTALSAELNVFARWFAGRGRKLGAIDIQNLGKERAQRLVKDLVRSPAYIALHSARAKLIGYRGGLARKSVQECAEYLRSLPNGAFLASYWLSAWDAALAGDADGQHRRFDTWIERVTRDLMDSALGMSTLVLAAASRLTELDPSHKKQLNKTYVTVDGHLKDLSSTASLDNDTKNLLGRIVTTTKSGEPMSAPADAFRYGMRWINQKLPNIKATVNIVEDVVRDYGRFEPRTNYSRLVWYDIIDSRGRKSGLKNGNLKDYRNKVGLFKTGISKDLYGLVHDARRNSCTVYPWQGDIVSRDDEKHIFLTGNRNVDWVRELIKVILKRSFAHEVYARIIVINADFAGIAAHKYDADADVYGDSFWEHLKNIKEYCRLQEDGIAENPVGHPPSTSFAWLVGDIIRLIESDSFLNWNPSYSEKVFSSVIDDTQIDLRIVGGTVQRRH